MYTNIIRFDFLFSYWVFIWYILYKIKITSYNPKLALLFVLFVNIIIMFVMIYYLINIINIIIHCIIPIIFIKIIPLITLKNNNKYEIYPLIFLFIFYNLWLYINNISLYKILNIQYNNIINNNPIGPLGSYINKLMNLNKIL